MTRDKIADIIYTKFKDTKDVLKKHFEDTSQDIGYFYIDDLLPKELVRDIYTNFPQIKELNVKKSIREYKYVTAQMDKYHPLLEEVIYAFQDERIVDLIAEICNYKDVEADKNLYAGGISMMGKGNYLHPHLDNSHNKDLELWRVLNLLYYVTPDWEAIDGGDLEIWNNGLKKDPISIVPMYNRLIVMTTHKKSWHSVRQVKTDKVRCCISNYYFSKSPVDSENSFHVTTFRGRPEHYLVDKILKLDSTLRMGIRKIFKKGLRDNPHVYKKEEKE